MKKKTTNIWHLQARKQLPWNLEIKMDQHLQYTNLSDQMSQSRVLNLGEFDRATADSTVRWLENLDLTEEQRLILIFSSKAGRICQRKHKSIGSVVDLSQGEKSKWIISNVHHLDQRKSKLCEVTDINDVTDWLQMLWFCANSDSSDLRKKLLLEKDLTFAKAKKFVSMKKKQLNFKTISWTCRSFCCCTSAYKHHRIRRTRKTTNQNPGFQQRGRSQSRGRNFKAYLVLTQETCLL